MRSSTLLRRAGPVLLMLALGAANAVLLLGPGRINPSNTSWISGDNATYYSAWEQYRHDTHLHVPLTWTDRIGYPAGTSIAFLDPIPLAAVALRPLSPILPEPFQYLGLWASLCFVLQAYFGFSLCRRLFPESVPFAVVGGLLLLLSPPLTARAAGHTTLLSQWLILAALDAYFRDPGDRPVQWMRRIWIVVAVAASITPYLAAMCALLTIAAIARLKIERRIRWGMAAGLVIATGAIVAASGAAFGVLASGDAESYWAPGYGQFSLNLNALINPMSHGSILLPPLPLAFPEQYEGYNYLGLGVLALLALTLVRRLRAFSWIRRPRLSPLLAVALISTAIAASVVVTLGARTLFTVHVPTIVMYAFGGLRASGRLFWPAYYLIVLGAIGTTYWLWTPRVRTLVLAAAVALQFADTLPLRHEIRASSDERFPSATPSAVWQDLGRRYDNLIVIPAFQCSQVNAPGGRYSFVYFGKLAAEQQMRLNSYYGARYTRHQLQTHCVDLLRSELAGNLDARSAYVVSDGVRTLWRFAGMTSHACRQADGFNLCTPADSGRSASPDSWTPPAAAPYTMGSPIDFTLAPGSAQRYETFGWSEPTAPGTWTEGPRATLRISLDASYDRSTPLRLDMSATPFTAAGRPPLDVDVFVNGARVAQWTYQPGSGETRQQAQIPAEVAGRRSELDIDFDFRNPTAPADRAATDFSQFLERACSFHLRCLSVRSATLTVLR